MRLALAALVILVLVGCSVRGALRPDTHTVRQGDTLYGIAQTYGLEWRDIARWNRIGPPYRIEPGQRISLDPYPPLGRSGSTTAGRAPVAAPPAARQPRVARAPQDSRAAQEAAIKASTPQLDRTIERSERRPAPAAPEPESSSDTASSETPVSSAPTRQPPQPAAPASEPAPATPTEVGGPSEDGWQWPASGSIVRGYAAQKMRQGIDIGGREGSPVYAASSGQVVYSGTGLKGYGQLIVIKHDAAYLSAYGFTRNTRVAEGQNVAAGARIADMGRGPQNEPMLHFEIRKDGRPIDPASVLPSDH